MKRLLFTSACLISSMLCVAQRYNDTRTYDIIGLPDGEEISDCLGKGMPFLLIGLVIFFVCIRRSKQAMKENKEDKGSWWGCLGLILIGIGVIIMLPLLAWIEAVIVFLISILAIAGAVYLIWKWISS